MQLSSVTNIDDLALCLNISKKQLNFFAFYATTEKKYSQFSIKKKSGDERKIAAPKKKLKEIQSSIYEQLKPHYKPRKAVHGYVEEKSIISNAKTHINQRWLGKVDIKSFFPTINTKRIIGIFQSSPFYLPHKVALTLSSLLVLNDELPQGSPCSPIISNLILRRFDARLNALSRDHKCYYSRYADDIFFSTNKKNYPREILYRNEDGLVLVGTELEKIFDDECFKINMDKVSLKDKSQRQIVTGIVVNERLNVPREYIRELRAMLYSWDKHGLDSAENHWLKNNINQNRKYNPELKPRFKWMVRGKLNHIAAVRGKTDDLYLKYAKKLAQLDSKYQIDASAIAASIASQINIYVEGKTDAVHLRSAMRNFHESARFTSLNLSFINETDANGDAELIKICHLLAKIKQGHLTIFLFDSDVENTTNQMKGSTHPYKDHGNNVYSIVMPSPEFRGEKICIEHLYCDDDLTKKTEDGLRIFKSDEFDKKNGIHISENDIIRSYPNNKTLIIDSNLINMSKKDNCALSKSKFAEMIHNKNPPFESVSFDGFIPLFDVFNALHSEYST